MMFSFMVNVQILKNSLYTVLSCNFPENENSEMLMFNLDIKGELCMEGLFVVLEVVKVLMF